MTYQRVQDEVHSDEEYVNTHPNQSSNPTAAAAPATAPPPPSVPSPAVATHDYGHTDGASGVGHQYYPNAHYSVPTPPPPAAPIHAMEEGGLHINVTMFDSWRTPLMPEVKDIPNLLKATLLMPCHAAAQQDDVNRLGVQAPRLVAFGTLAPVIALDVLPCLCCGIPFPFGSFSSTLDARRAVRTAYRLHGSVLRDLLSSACVPCAMLQMHKEMELRDHRPQTFVME